MPESVEIPAPVSTAILVTPAVHECSSLIASVSSDGMTAAFGTSLAEYAGTIPALLERAAERDPGGTWLRTDELTLTFEAAAGRVSAIAAELGAAGIGPGDLVMLTTRTTPQYLLSWLAVLELGAVTVPVNPASAVAELTGLVGQVQPKAVLTDAALASASAPDWLGQGDGRARLVMDVNGLGAGQPDRPPSARLGGRGRPYQRPG